jgi:hypothetical protein
VLHISYYDMFKWAPTLLVSGSKLEIASLRDVLAEWHGETISLAGILRLRTTLHMQGITDLILESAPSERMESSAVLERDKAVWRLSTFDQDRIVGLLEGLCRGKDTGHQYLESNTSPIQILCSTGEY